ncbi:MAG: 3-deoxy-7-phosphoheptulonate synthase class II [Planctomycetaceae bacterium]|jgi:3-deoxy-7-phosphoheptulonate synthase|nr:3-deoxy-7-phosphoheptulonate synthase class II [Planctomycetaceae bacterium]
MNDTWTPASWKQFPAAQQPNYADQAELQRAVEQLEKLPPLVTSWEIDHLKDQLAAAQLGKAWMLQGGDCAESFQQCQTEQIASKLKLLLQMSLVIVFASRKQIVRVGRIAGQYAKPRSSDTEVVGGVKLPCYRGDIVNGFEFNPESRRPDPLRLVRGYERSAATLNFIRALSEGGFADLHHPENWNLLFVNEVKGEVAKRYRELVSSLGSALRFMETILGGATVNELKRVDFFTSHEALLLPYESALTRASIRGVGYYNMGTHMPWIGERTRSLQGAHVEYFRGIKNPIGVKIGPSAQPDEVVDLAKHLNPDNEPGRLTLIHRMGRNQIESKLPPIIEAVRKAQCGVLWVCDPMHGNTIATQHGRKTRRFDDVVDELRLSFGIHHACGSSLGGAHLELTGDNVTECTGGSRKLTESDLDVAYETQVDPRLNYEQALEIAFEIAGKLQEFRVP